MKINRSINSPNFDSQNIQVEFIVLHYSAGNLERTLTLLTDPSTKVSCHLVISETGEIFEIVRCLEGTAYRAWHAGKSFFTEGEETWEDFNNFSIGIELVNPNGNILAYTDSQYEVLASLINYLKTLYPNLGSPNRVVGHEQISGWRGKADPGHMFNWDLLYKLCYPDHDTPNRRSVCPISLKLSLEKFLKVVPDDNILANDFWHALSSITETSICLIHEAKSNPDVLDFSNSLDV